MDEHQAFQEAVISMGDLSGLVEDMRRLGQEAAVNQTVSTSKVMHISTAGIITGVLLTLFGIFTVAILYLMGIPRDGALGQGILVVAGVALTTFGILTRETNNKYGMNMVRAALSLGWSNLGLVACSLATRVPLDLRSSFYAIKQTRFSLLVAGFFLPKWDNSHTK